MIDWLLSVLCLEHVWLVCEFLGQFRGVGQHLTCDHDLLFECVDRLTICGLPGLRCTGTGMWPELHVWID